MHSAVACLKFQTVKPTQMFILSAFHCRFQLRTVRLKPATACTHDRRTDQITEPPSRQKTTFVLSPSTRWNTVACVLKMAIRSDGDRWVSIPRSARTLTALSRAVDQWYRRPAGQKRGRAPKSVNRLGFPKSRFIVATGDCGRRLAIMGKKHRKQQNNGENQPSAASFRSPEAVAGISG